jgi:hypothetical protein
VPPHNEVWSGKRVDRAPGFAERATAVLGERAAEILQGVETTLARASRTYGVLAREIGDVRIYAIVTEPTVFSPAAVIYFTDEATITLCDIMEALPDDPGL